jgi:hypothetical protein
MNFPDLSDFVRQEYANPSDVREVDPMSAIYPLSVYRRVERQWAERINSVRRARGQVVAGTERTLRRASNNDGALVAAPVSAVVNHDRVRPRD